VDKPTQPNITKAFHEELVPQEQNGETSIRIVGEYSEGDKQVARAKTTTENINANYEGAGYVSIIVWVISSAISSLSGIKLYIPLCEGSSASGSCVN